MFQNLHCLSLVVCSNTTLLKLNVVCTFFQILRFEIGCAAYLWMRLIHGRLRYHYVRLEIQYGIIELTYVPTDNNVADLFTKPVTRVSLDRLLRTFVLIVCAQPFCAGNATAICHASLR